MLAGIVVANETGLEALVFYLAAYCLHEPRRVRRGHRP